MAEQPQDLTARAFLSRLQGAALAIMFFALPGAAASTAVIDSGAERMTVTSFASWYREPPGSALNPAEALDLFEAGRFQSVGNKEWLELGLTSDVHWVAVKVRNETNNHQFVLQYENPRTSYVDLHIPRGDSIRSSLNGSARPFSGRELPYPLPVFPVTLQPGQEQVLLLRVYNVGDFRTRLTVTGTAGFLGEATTSYYPHWIAVGIFLAIALVQLIVFVTLRDTAYGYQFLFVISSLLFLMASNGTGPMVLWPDWQWLALRANTLFFVCMSASFLMFALKFLDAEHYTPWMYRLGLLFAAVCVLHLLYTSLYDSLWRMYLNRYIGIAAVAVMWALAIQSVRKGSPGSMFFLGAWSFVMAAAVIMLLLSWYVVPAQAIAAGPVIVFLFIASVLLWTFELINRARLRAREQRKILEQKVATRTRDLSRKTEELEHALAEVTTLSGLLPICSSCKKIRDDSGYWNSVESYVSAHTQADFTHSLCPDCVTQLYPELKYARRFQQRGGEAPA